MNEVDESKLPALVSATKAAGVWQVPTQVLMDNLLNDVPTELAERPEMKYVPPETLKNWIAQKQTFQKFRRPIVRSSSVLRRRLIKALHDAGVPFALGSDAPQFWNVPGFSAHRELRSLVDAGLTPYQALGRARRTLAPTSRRSQRPVRSPPASAPISCCSTPIRCRTSTTPGRSPG